MPGARPVRDFKLPSSSIGYCQWHSNKPSLHNVLSQPEDAALLLSVVAGCSASDSHASVGGVALEGVTLSLRGGSSSWDGTLKLGCALGARASGDATVREGAASRAALAAAFTVDLAFASRRRVSVLTGLPFVFAMGLCNTYA